MSENTKNHHVLRLEKRQKNGWSSYLAHSTRLHTPKNVDPSRLHENVHFVGLNDDGTLKQVEFSAPKLQAKVREQAKKQVDERVGKLRANAVYVTETIISASKEHLATMTKEQQIEYLTAGVQYLIDKFGKDNFVSAHFHFDEETPHAHVFTSAVTLDSKTGKYKTHYKAFIDGPKQLSEFQDNFHHQIGQKYGLAPNSKKERITHTETAEFSALVKKHKTDVRTKNIDELNSMIGETYAKNAVETIISSAIYTDEIIYEITGKMAHKLNLEESEVLSEVCNEKNLTPLRLRYEKTLNKRKEERQTAEEKKAEEEHKTDVAYNQIQPYVDIWRNYYEDYVYMVRDSLRKNRYAPKSKFADNLNSTNNVIALQKRMDDIQDELQDFYDDREVGIRLKENVSRALSTPKFEFDKQDIPKFVRQSPRPHEGQLANIREWLVNNPEMAIRTFSARASAKQVVNMIVNTVKDFLKTFKDEIRELKAEIRLNNYKAYRKAIIATYTEQKEQRVAQTQRYNPTPLRMRM